MTTIRSPLSDHRKVYAMDCEMVQVLFTTLLSYPQFLWFLCNCFKVISHDLLNHKEIKYNLYWSTWLSWLYMDSELEAEFALLLEFLENSWISRALENSLKIQFWHQLLENSLNLSTNLSCRIKKILFWTVFLICKYLVLKKIDVKFTTLGSWIFLFIHWEAPGKLLEFHNIQVVQNPVEGQYCK